MHSPALSHTHTNDTVTLGFPGDLLSTSADVLRQQALVYMDTLNPKAAGLSVMHLDLSKAKMIDSAGLNVLVTLVREAKTRGAKVKATVTSNTVQRTLLFTRLDRHMEIQYYQQ